MRLTSDGVTRPDRMEFCLEGQGGFLTFSMSCGRLIYTAPELSETPLRVRHTLRREPGGATGTNYEAFHPVL